MSLLVLDSILPRVLPAGWRVREEGYDGRAYVRDDGLSVIASLGEHGGRQWFHVSLARPNRLPTWDEFKLVKNIFVGRDRYAYSVLPSDAKYVNIHPYCLHMWCVIEGDEPLPDFTNGGATL